MRCLCKIRRFFSKCANFFLIYLLVGEQFLNFSLISALKHSENSFGQGMSLKSTDLSVEQLEEFKRNFLTKLGLQSRIKRHIQTAKTQQKPSVEVPEYLWDIYDRIVAQNRAEFESNDENFVAENSFELAWGSDTNTIRNVFADSQEPYESDGAVGTLLSFNLTRIPNEETFTEAELRLRIVKNRGQRVRISISELVDSCKGIIQLLDTKIVPSDEGFRENSVIFDVLPAVRRTLSAGNRTLNFVIDIRDANGKPIGNASDWMIFQPTGDDISVSDSDSQAALLLFSTDSLDGATHRRVKRGTRRGKNRRRKSRRRHGKKRIMSRNNMCKKRGLYVDFRELNWQDWILAPSGYEAHFCSGTCEYPIVDAQNTTNHAIVQSLVNSVTPGAVPPPCCVPTEMSAISMLYIDIDNRIVIKNYPEMIVEGCGCR